MGKGFQLIQYDLNTPFPDESAKRIAYLPPVETAKLGVYSAYCLIVGFIFMSLFLM
jgi:hypothetical protein